MVLYYYANSRGHLEKESSLDLKIKGLIEF